MGLLLCPPTLSRTSAGIGSIRGHHERNHSVQLRLSLLGVRLLVHRQVRSPDVETLADCQCFHPGTWRCEEVVTNEHIADLLNKAGHRGRMNWRYTSNSETDCYDGFVSGGAPCHFVPYHHALEILGLREPDREYQELLLSLPVNSARPYRG